MSATLLLAALVTPVAWNPDPQDSSAPVAASPDGVDVRVRWKRPLGSGYSGIAGDERLPPLITSAG